MTLCSYRSRVFTCRSPVLMLAAIAVLSGLAGIEECRSQPIDVYEPATWQRPVLIAHRGGVVNDAASENSAAAIRLAAEQGFAMIEVDVRESKDHVPVAFHDGSLLEAAGVDAAIEDLSLEQINSIRHRHTGEGILTLDHVFELCARLDLGVMLDIKTDGSEQFFREIGALVEEHRLTRSAITFSGHPLAIRHLEGSVMFAITEGEEESVRRGEAISLTAKFWFGLPRNLEDEMVEKLQARGALVIPAINIFRYLSDSHMESAREDINRMQSAGVDAFQIDAVYAPLFESDGTESESTPTGAR